MTVTARGLNRATLERQLLLRREPVSVEQGVRRVVALQAQQPESPYLALWNRLAGFDPADLDVAFAERQVVKATLMRITLHAVHVDDFQAFHEAMQPTLRGARLGDPRFTSSGLSIADFDALVPELLAHASQPRTVADLEAWLAERLGVEPRGVWWALRSSAPLWHEPSGPPWGFGQRPSFVAADTTPILGDRDRADAALKTLVCRYLEGFGPASIADVAQFALVQRARVKQAVQGLAAELEQLEGPDGVALYDVPGAPRPPDDVPAPPRLLPMWDSVLLGYADRSRVIPPDYRPLVTRINGDVLPMLLVDGYVAGVWRVVDGAVEATAFRVLPKETWAGLAAEAAGLLDLLAARESRIYTRFDHWWAKLPAGEVRVLGR